MAGKPGRSGRPRKPLAYHLLTGGYRPDRHGPLPANVALKLAPPVWTPDPDAVAALRPAGRALVEALLGVYEFTVVEGMLVLEAGRAADAVAAWRERQPDDDVTEALRSRLELQWQRQFAALLTALKVSA